MLRVVSRGFQARSIGCAAVFQQRNFAVSTSSSASETRSYRLVILGAGSSGIAIASKFVSQFGNNRVAIVEPVDVHFYQPMLTLIGAGLKDFSDCYRPMTEVLPATCDWIQDSATQFDPENSQLTTKSGTVLKYDFLVVAMGLQLNFNQIKGCLDALSSNDSNVCSVYSTRYVRNVRPTIDKLTSGNAVFTFPITPVKCAGAAQKICYLAEDIISKKGLKKEVKFIYNTGPPIIFSSPYYAAALEELAVQRQVEWNKCLNLIEVKPDSHRAVFDVMKDGKSTGETKTFKYSMLHVTPPMSTPSVLHGSPLVDATNYVEVDKYTLQHVRHKNVFGIGDCTNVPTSKTAAACAAQIGVLGTNLKQAAEGKELTGKYDGYTSCPLVVNTNKVMLAEFGYDNTVLETFPFDQRVPRRSMFYLKAHWMPPMYWNLFLRGLWHGPAFFRNLWKFF